MVHHGACFSINTAGSEQFLKRPIFRYYIAQILHTEDSKCPQTDEKGWNSKNLRYLCFLNITYKFHNFLFSGTPLKFKWSISACHLGWIDNVKCKWKFSWAKISLLKKEKKLLSFRWMQRKFSFNSCLKFYFIFSKSRYEALRLFWIYSENGFKSKTTFFLALC